MVAQSKPRKHKLKAGDKFGFLTLIQRVADDNKTKSINLKVRWRMECECGKRMTIPAYYVTRVSGPKQHCGCKDKTIKTIYFQEYRIWNMMHVRCEDPRHEAYKHYGGRGIKICPEWHKNRGEDGFRSFLEFIGPRPGPEFSIDRVDNDLGYQPYQEDGVTRQLRWATSKEQRANQRPRA